MVCSANRVMVPSFDECRERVVDSGEKDVVEHVEMTFTERVEHIIVLHEVEQLVEEDCHGVVHVSPQPLDPLVMH